MNEQEQLIAIANHLIDICIETDGKVFTISLDGVTDKQGNNHGDWEVVTRRRNSKSFIDMIKMWIRQPFTIQKGNKK